MASSTFASGRKIETRPVSPALGTEFLNLDLRVEQPPEVVAAIKTAFLETGLVLVRSQDITFEQQERFAAYIGTPTTRFVKHAPENWYGMREFPSTEMYISNTREQGTGRRGSLLKHSDYCFDEELLLGISLFGEVVPSFGGATIFVNAKLAADRLNPSLRARLEAVDVRHVYEMEGSETGAIKYDISDKEYSVSWVRPALLSHPVTGEQILYVNELMTDRVEGLDKTDSEALLLEIYEVLDDSAVRYDHVWSEGDVIVFDNIKLQHGRTDMAADEPRSLRRLQVA